MEEWKSIPGYEDLYETSDFGRVRNTRTGKVLKPDKTKDCYYRVCLCKDGKHKWFSVHRLVWSAFNGEIPEGMQIDHIDGDKSNNHLNNLRCCTPKENQNNPNTKPRHIEANRKRSQSLEWRINNAEANRKKAQSPEWRKNHADAMRKRSQSPEWKKNMTDAVRKANSKAIVQIDKQTGETIKRFECAKDVERELGINQANISACCTGKRKSAGGYYWKYVP